MKIEFKSPRKVVLTITPKQLDTIQAALDSVESSGAYDEGGVYGDVPLLYEELRKALRNAEIENFKGGSK